MSTDLVGRLSRLDRSIEGADRTGSGRLFSRAASRLLGRDLRIRPGFSSSWVLQSVGEDAEKILSYPVGDSLVTLWRAAHRTDLLYDLAPAEYAYPPSEVELIEAVRSELLDEEPEDLQTASLAGARRYVERMGRRALGRRLASGQRDGRARGEAGDEGRKTAHRLATVLTRYTAGFGVIEYLLLDPHVQDIYVDAPAHRNPVYVTIGGLDDPRITGKCVTNILLSDDDLRSFVARMQYESGQPFSEARPHLECDLDLFNTRVTVVGRPLSPEGTALALRRHALDPWTLPRLIASGSLSAYAAALLSFFLDGQSTVLVAGARGAGKTSLLAALLFEFPDSQRMLAIEDTPELPVRAYQSLGYKVQALLTRSSTATSGGTSAVEALRVSLRLGESVIVLGEVRGEEARVLYEAMRTGSAGSSVLGTIHGNSPESVYERVVHDLGISPSSFGATDLVVVAGLRRPKGQQRRVRRIVAIAEVVKGTDGKFLDLLGYDEGSDTLIPRAGLRESPRLQLIARSWGMTTEQALQNIDARRRAREILLQAFRESGDARLLHAPVVRDSNAAFWSAVDLHGSDSGQVLRAWEEWFGGFRRRHSSS